MAQSSGVMPTSWSKGPDVISQADSLVEQARALDDGQLSDLEGASLAFQYNAALAAQIESKEEQVGRLEDRLEALIDQQAARLHQTQGSQPGLLAMPGAKTRWQTQVLQQESGLHRLQSRLDAIRDIKEGMGLHGPRVEELAARKLRREHPELAKDWEALMQAQRLREALMRKQEHQSRRASIRDEESSLRSRRMTFTIPT